MPDFFPEWALEYTGEGRRVENMRRGKLFADWADKQVGREQAGGQLEHQARLDPETGEAVLNPQGKPIHDMVGKYRAELPLIDQGMGEEWKGFADVLINNEGRPVLADFKMPGQWTGSHDPQKYAAQLTPYQAVYEEKFGVKPDIATIYVSKDTWRFLEAALANQESGIKPKDILDELTNSSNRPGWTNPAIQSYAEISKSDQKRQVQYETGQALPESTMRPLIDAHKRYDEAIEAATGMTRGQLRSKMSSMPLEEDKERVYAFMEEVHFRAQMYSAGVYANTGVVKGFVDKMAPILPGHQEGSSVARSIEDYNKVKAAPQEKRGVAPFDPLRNQSQWEQLDPRLGDSVLWRPDTGEVAITHQREGAYGKDAYWRGNIERMGNQVAINGRLLVPQQLQRHDIKEGQRLPGQQWEDPTEVLPAIFSKAVGMIRGHGGGVNAAKAITQHMNQALQPMPTVSGDIFSVSAARMSYQQGLAGLESNFGVRQQYKVMGEHRATRGGSRQSFDLRDLAQSAGFAYNPATDKFYGGEAKPGSIFKRARAGLRTELVAPTKMQGTTRVWDADRMMLSPLVQRDPTGTQQASRYGPEIGTKAKAAIFGHGGLMPEGMGYGTRQFLGMGDQQMWSQRVTDTIEVEGDVQFTGLDRATFDKESGGFTIGYVGNDPSNRVVWSKAKWDRFDLDTTPTFRKEGGKTVISLSGMASTRGGSGQLKAWLGNKAMLTAMNNIGETFGNEAMQGADLVLPKAKNVRQLAYGLISAKYGNDPVALAKGIYGEERYQQFLVNEDAGEGGIALGAQAAGRVRGIRERLGQSTAYQGVLMPLEETDQERMYGLAKDIAKERMETNAQYRMYVTDMEQETFKRAGLVMKNLGSKRDADGQEVRHVEVQVPALFTDLFMQMGREFPGEAQVSTEELFGLAGDPADRGSEYRKAVMEKVLPNIMKASGHYREMYSSILTARMHTRKEGGVEVSSDRVIDFNDLRASMGDTGRNTSEFLQNIAEIPEARGKFIKIGDMLIPPIETLTALQVPDDPSKTMHWLTDEKRQELSIDTKDVSAITNSFMRIMEKGLDVDTVAKLEESLYGTGVGGQKQGLAMTPAVAKGVMAARMARGGVEGAAVSYSGIDENVVVMGQEQLMKMFGSDDVSLINDAIKKGAYAAVQRRPNVFPELSSMVGVRLESASSSYAQRRGIPKDFAGTAYASKIAGMMFGDYDGDRVMALLTSTIAQSSTGDVKDKTDSVVKWAASRRGLTRRWGEGMAHMMGHESATAALGLEEGTELTDANLLDLNIKLGTEYSEVFKGLADLTEGQEKFVGAMQASAEQRGDSLADMFLDKGKFMAGVSARDLRGALEGEAVSKEETSRAYNRLIREMHGYIGSTGEGDSALASVFGFRAYQKTLDMSGFSEGLRGYMNMWEGYNAWGKGKSLQERLGPVGSEGQVPSREVSLYALKDDFTVQLMDNLLKTEELWSAPKSASERGEGQTGYNLADDPKARWQAQASGISSDPETQKAIAGVLSSGGGAQEIWDKVFGAKSTAETPRLQARDRFAKAWQSPGWLMGAPGAAGFSRMKRSMYQGDMASVVNRTAEWDRLDRLTGGQMERLSGVGKAMSAQTHVLSGRGGERLPEAIKQFPNVPGSEVLGEMLNWMDESIPRRQPPGEMADLLRFITGGEDDLLQTLEGLGFDAQELSKSMPALQSMVKEMQTPEMGYKEGKWQEQGLVPQVLSEWSKKVTGEGGVGGLFKQLAERQAGGEISVPAAFQYQAGEGYEGGASAGIARALGMTSVGAPPLAPRGVPQGEMAQQQGVSGEQRMAVGGVAGAMQTMVAQATATGDVQMLHAIRGTAAKGIWGDKPREPIRKQMQGLKAQETFAETYGKAYDITGQREAAMQLAQKKHGVQGAGSLPAALSMLEKSRGDVGAAAQLMPELTEENVSTLEGLNDALGRWTETIGPAVESGKELDKTQVKYTKVLEQGLAQVPKLRMMAESAQKGPLRERALALSEELQGAGAALGPAKAAIAGQQWKELQGEIGAGAKAGQMFRKLTGGFEMMRMQRLWGMTGGMAMGAIQPAAQEQMGAMQAAGMGMPSGQFEMGGLAKGILGARARQQQFQLNMGRAAGRAYGPTQGLLAQPAIGEAAGIALPAVGVGLLAGQVAGMAGLAAGPWGLAAGLGAGLAGTASHLTSSTESDRLGALAKSERGEYSLDLLASETGRRVAYSKAAGVLGTPITEINKLVGSVTGQDLPSIEQATRDFSFVQSDRDALAASEGIRSGDMSGMSMENRAQTIQYAYKESAPQWMEQTAAQELGAQIEKYTGKSNYQDIYESKEFRQMAARGQTVEQFVGTAGQWGGGPEDWQQYQQFYAGVPETKVPGMEYTADKWASVRTGTGMEGIDILGAAASPFETGGQRGDMAAIAGKFGDALSSATGGLIDFGDALEIAVGDTPLKAERLTTLQTSQLEQAMGTSERARIMGLQGVQEPEQLTAAWAKGAFQEQMPLLQGRMGLQQQAMGMGLGMGGGAAMAEQFQTPGQMQMFQRFLGGDQRTMSMLGQAAVQGPFQPNVDIGGGMQTNAGAMRGQFLGAVESGMQGAGYAQPQITESMQQLTKAFDDLRPVIETDTGLRMGTTRMWEGWSQDITGGAGSPTGPSRQQRRGDFLEAQGMQLPEIGGYGGVDENIFQRFTDILQDTGIRGVQAQQTTRQNQYQEFQMGQRERGMEWSRVSQLGGSFSDPEVGDISTRGSLAITKELRGLGRMWEDFTSTYNKRSQEVSRSQFLENWEVQAQRAPQQFAWQREDLAAQGSQASLQYGWQMEDLQESGRFATGRDRRKIQRQQERATVSYSMQMGRLDTQGERVDTREQWSKDDLARQKRQFLERNALQDDYQSKYRSHMESRRQLEDELYAVQEYSAQFQLKQQEDAVEQQRIYQEEMKAIQAVMTAYSQSLENANAQMGQVVQMVQFMFANLAVGGGGQFNLPNAAQGFFATVQAGFATTAQSVQLPHSGNKR